MSITFQLSSPIPLSTPGEAEALTVAGAYLTRVGAQVASRFLGCPNPDGEAGMLAGLSELSKVRELGDANAVRLEVALELGRRLAAFSPDDRPKVGTPNDVGQGPSTVGTL